MPEQALMDIYRFGDSLVRSRDLDPVYVIVHEAQLEPPLLHRWLLAYWCFYHCGTASWISDVRPKDEGGYWQRMEAAACSKDYPRSAERRHFRGQNSISSVAWLKERGVNHLFGRFTEASHKNKVLLLRDVLAYIQTWKGFGPWIAFKVADMLERLGICLVDCTEAHKFLFDSPEKGAESLWTWESNNEENIPEGVGKWAIARIIDTLGDTMAPPSYNRPIGPMEAETILCKWHAHINGRYHIGKDTQEIKHGLLRFPKCQLSQKLLAVGVRTSLW